MTIHTLHDLCYAYAVAEPVREMLFALQDRIDALEAQRTPLSDEQLNDLVMEHLGPHSLTGGKMSVYDAFLKAVRVTEAAHGIKEGT